jgi:hypothetical protein
MLQKLIHLLIVGLVLFVVFLVVGMFVGGQILTVIGVILALVFLLYALRAFGIALFILALTLSGCVAPTPYVSVGVGPALVGRGDYYGDNYYRPSIPVVVRHQSYQNWNRVDRRHYRLDRHDRRHHHRHHHGDRHHRRDRHR